MPEGIPSKALQDQTAQLRYIPRLELIMPGERPARADTCAKVLYLHIGTSRTATTTLQQHVLSHLRGVSQFTKKPGQGMKISRAGGRNLLALLDRQAQFMSQLKTQESSNVLMQIRLLAYNASIRSATHK